MRVGIIIVPEKPWREARSAWIRAEEYGFAHAWTYDHLGWRDLVDGPWFDAIPTLTAAAQVTERIKLGTMVASPNFRHPVHFAREVSTLQDIAGGRFMLGVGSGGLGFDAEVLGWPALSKRARVDRYAEFVELLDLLLRTGRVTWTGSYYQAVDARCVQTEIPLVLAAAGPRAMDVVTRFGQAWVTGGDLVDDIEAWWRSVERVSRLNTSSEVRYLQLDRAPIYSLSSVSYFFEAVDRARQLGFTDVLTHWPRESGWYQGKESVLEAVAADLAR